MIRTQPPPNFDRVLAAFPSAGKPGVLFAYGPDVYNPSGVFIPDWLMAHERKHCERQQDPAAWWEKYITDSEFRYQEELLAHAAEFAAQIENVRDGNARIRLEMSTALRLIAPLYNYKPSRPLSQAVKDLRFMHHRKF